MLVRARVELTTLALSAPRSADWANRPDILHSFLVRCVCLQKRHSIKWVTHGKAILNQVALKKAPVSLAKGRYHEKQNKRTQNCLHGVYEFLSEKRPRITWIAYTSENLSEAYTSGIQRNKSVAPKKLERNILGFFSPQVAGRGISSNGRALA